ncbi:hypothetical protein M3Y97_00874900 [Aphelenchoides bicaudatus]|nr:hypothetical protein M3Y97_00874900 [Aphelenchoides bicaudatus]
MRFCRSSWEDVVCEFPVCVRWSYSSFMGIGVVRRNDSVSNGNTSNKYGHVADESLDNETEDFELSTLNASSLLVGYVSPLNSQHEFEDQQISAPFGFNFICHPVAGTSQSSHCNNLLELPSHRVNLTDVQLSNIPLPVNGRISSWIDCDNPDDKIASHSMKQLDSYELANAEYLGFRSVVIEIKRRNNPNLLRILYKWLWKRNSSLCFWIIYPSSLDQIQDSAEKDEMWTLWADFRRELKNCPQNRLVVGIKFGSQIDQEFVDLRKLNRWKGEPLNVFWFDLDEQICEIDEFGGMRLKNQYAHVFNNTFYSSNQKCSNKSSNINSTEFLNLLRVSMKRLIVNNATTCLDDLGVSFDDQFQTPLRPAEDNLSCSVYSTFEKHVHKYELYGKAILHAVTDLFEEGVCSSSKPPIIFVVGAGRGGIVEQVFKAEAHLNEKRAVSTPKKWTVVAIEKNPFAVLSLEASNRQRFMNRVKIVQADARDINALQVSLKEKADLIVSEMLGSFGCNELSPEMLECVEKAFLPRKNQPIHSLRMLQSVKARQSGFYERLQWQKARDPNSTLASTTEQFYVVPLNRLHRLLEDHTRIQKCFTFNHPNADQAYSQAVEHSFKLDVTCDVTGFAGYFDAVLYKNHYLSTLPGNHHNAAAMSWFPIYVPVQEPIRCPVGSQLTLKMKRCKDNTGVWYEWQESNGEIIFESAVQNQNGQFDFMRLTSDEETE